MNKNEKKKKKKKEINTWMTKELLSFGACAWHSKSTLAINCNIESVNSKYNFRIKILPFTFVN